MVEKTPAIELRNLTKAYGACVANSGISLRAMPGTIHGVIGENGAGKSTAMKMLYGMTRPDSGEILVDGKPRRWGSPADAIAAGIGMVHQHFMLAGPHTALDNVLLGAEPRKGIAIDRAGAKRKLEALSKEYGMPVDWDAPVEKLSVGVQQRIEILKLLYRDARILILDEPTAVLTPQETNELFARLRRLCAEGRTVIVITHKLREVMAFTDQVTVFRAGKVSGERETSTSSAEELAELMVGRKVLLRIDVPEPKALGPAVLETQGLSLRSESGKGFRLCNISLAVRAGEIVGIAGVEGNGQSELLQAILHPSDPGCRTSGSVKVLGSDATALETREIKARGVGVIPQDRHHEGLLLDRPLTENFILGKHRDPRFSRFGFLRSKAVREESLRLMEEHDVRPRSLDALAGGLSGGNQQKVIIGREFLPTATGEPRLLVAAQPTRGVDIGAIEAIHQRIVRARDRGAGVLLVSSELDEVLTLSDRVIVLYEGKVVAEFSRGQCDEKKLGLAMGGGTHESA